MQFIVPVFEALYFFCHLETVVKCIIPLPTYCRAIEVCRLESTSIHTSAYRQTLEQQAPNSAGLKI